MNTVYKGINTINRLDVVESERDRWQRPSEVIAVLNLEEGKVVADVGSGAGYFALKLSRSVGASGKILAVDIRKLPLAFLWIRAFSRSQRNIGIRVADPDDPHLPIGILDAVLIANTYHEFANPDLTIEHTLRSLRFGGRLVVLDRGQIARDSGGELGRTQVTVGLPAQQDHHHELSPEAVDSELRQKGFEILERHDRFIDRPTGERWWLIVARKPRK